MPIFTIGHGNIELNRFLEILVRNRINVLVDVRSVPYSHYAPQFSREILKDVTSSSEDIRYLFLGHQLGGKPTDPKLLTNGVPDFNKMRNVTVFRSTLEQVIAYATDEGGKVALMCSEEDPEKCHRYLLISECIFEQGYEVYHLRHSGEVILHSELRKNMAPEQICLPLGEGADQ